MKQKKELSLMNLMKILVKFRTLLIRNLLNYLLKNPDIEIIKFGLIGGLKQKVELIEKNIVKM